MILLITSNEVYKEGNGMWQKSFVVFKFGSKKGHKASL